MLRTFGGWAAILPASALIALVFVIADLGSPLRPLVTLWFLFICPGMAIVRLLAIRDRFGALMLSVVLSVALATLTALAMIYGHMWSPRLGVGVLAVVTLTATMLPVVLHEPLIQSALHSERWQRMTPERIAERARLHILLGAQVVLQLVGLTLLVRRALWWLTGRGSRMRAAREIVPRVRAEIPVQEDLPPPADWTALRPLPTIADRLVFLMGPRRQPPVAVVKLARNDQAQRNMERETATILALQADPRLGDWGWLLPQVLAHGEMEGLAYRVERLLPGVPATILPSHADDAYRFQSAAATTISTLHQRTAARVRIDAERLRPWVDDPIDALLELCEARAGWTEYLVVLERLRADLRRALLNRPITLSWVHGDYWPANILVSDDAETVSGIIDWDLAEAEGLPLLDLMHLFLSMRMIERKQEMGVVVRALLQDPDWTHQERAIIAAARAVLHGGRIGMRDLMLLTWLRHVDLTRTKARRFGGPLIWESQNVERVLEVL